MNTLSINKYDSLLREILMEEEETRAQNMRIDQLLSYTKEINLSPKTPLSHQTYCSPPSSQISSHNPTQVTVNAKTCPKNSVYAKQKSERSTNLLFVSYRGGFREVANHQMITTADMSKALKKGRTFSMPSDIHLLLPHHLASDFAAE